MSSKPVVMVIGASGNIGSATISALVSKYADSLNIRAGVRNPDKADKLKEFQGQINIVKATMGDDNLFKSLNGVNRLFIVTPPSKDRVELIIRTAQSAKKADVKSIVVITASKEVIKSTILGRMFKDLESSLMKLNFEACTFLCLPFFVENYFAFKDSIINQSTIYMAVDPAKPFTTVVVSDAGKAAAAVLAQPAKHAGKTYNVISNRHSMNEVCAEFSRYLGKQIQYVRQSYEDTKKGLMQAGIPEWQADGLIETYQLIDKGSQMINSPDIGDYLKITGMAPTTLQDWVASVAIAFQ